MGWMSNYEFFLNCSNTEMDVDSKSYYFNFKKSIISQINVVIHRKKNRSMQSQVKLCASTKWSQGKKFYIVQTIKQKQNRDIVETTSLTISCSCEKAAATATTPDLNLHLYLGIQKFAFKLSYGAG